MGLTPFLCFTIFASILGMFQFGYNTGVINSPESSIESFIQSAYKSRYNEEMTEHSAKLLFSVAVSIFAIGGMFGGISGGFLANKFGRKGGMLLNNVMGLLGAVLMGFSKSAKSYEMLLAGRFFIGVNCGLNTSLCPMYVSEIAPVALRGGLGTVNQLAVTVGILASEVLGLDLVFGTASGWPVLLGLSLCPPVLQLLLLPFCPESPRYLLITKNREHDARKALEKLRGSSEVEDEMEEMAAERRAEASESAISVLQLLRSPMFRAPLLISLAMQLSQQLSGINAVFYYSTNIFKKAGLAESDSKYMTIGIGVVMVLMVLVTVPLMDRAGRRVLHLSGLAGMFIFSLLMTISFLLKNLGDWMSYVSVVSTLMFVVFFALGPGSIPWLITAELFSQGPRPTAMSIAVLVNWLANFLVGIGFPTMQEALKDYTFIPFSILLAIFWIFTYKKVPETKNKTFEEILLLFQDKSTKRMSYSS